MFVLPSKTIYFLLLLNSDAWKVANTRWIRNDLESTWRTRWKFLWRSDPTRRAKIFLWRITIHGLYTKERAQTLGYNNGFYFVYIDISEMLGHIFFSCSKAQQGWASNALFFESDSSSNYLANTHSFIDILDSGLDRTPIGIACL